MNKKVLPLAVGAASAVVMTAAHAAMYVNERGTGETLIFPFYSAENSNNTNINIANTTGAHKAVKVRVLEAQNSQEVIDFNLYLSPMDHFSFVVMETADGGAALKTADNSCTVPAIPEDGVAFRNLLYAGDKQVTDPAAADDFDNTGLGRTQVGYIEVIEMGQLDPASAALIDADGKTNAAAAITHDAAGVPANCDILVKAWSNITGVDGVWLAESKNSATGSTGNSEFLANWSGGGLYGYASVINVEQGATFGYDAIAISDHVAAGATGSDMHYEPGDIFPNFADSALDTASIVSVNGAAVTMDFTGDYPDAGTQRVQALNALIMASEVYNDYVTDADIGATTDWLMTFPTKAFHINSSEPVEPFSKLWNGQTACEPSELSAVDREESTPPPPPEAGSSGPDFSPAPPADPVAPPEGDDVPLCYEATIVQFAEESAAGTSSVAIGVGEYLDAANGWATISLMPADLDATLGPCGLDGDITTTDDWTNPCDRSIDSGDGTLFGLPVVGFAVQKYIQSSASATYAMATEHKSCAVGSGTVANDC